MVRVYIFNVNYARVYLRNYSQTTIFSRCCNLVVYYKYGIFADGYDLWYRYRNNPAPVTVQVEDETVINEEVEV